MSERNDDGTRATPQAIEVLIIAADPAHRETASGAAMIAGVRIVPGAASARLNDGAIDVVVADIRGCDDETAEAMLREVEGAARAAPLRVIVALDEAQIDLAAAGIFGPHVQFLCAPTIVDFATALAEAKIGRSPRTREDSRDSERLRRLNEEVARIAETLARLARESVRNGEDRSVRDVARGYGARPAVTVDVAGAVTAPVVRGAIRARRMRGQFFDPDLFADPAWDMLLDLFAASLEGGRVSVSSLCIAAAVPGTTALRWIGMMTEGGLLVRDADPLDRRRAYVGLSPDASAAMTGYFGATAAARLASA